MTPEEEATFITLWQQGLTSAAIAARLGIPPGTARSRAYTLQQQGKIPPRPKGGRRIPALATTDGPPATHPRAPASPAPPRDHLHGGPRSPGIDPYRQGLIGAGGHPHPRDHQAMDGPVVATPD